MPANLSLYLRGVKRVARTEVDHVRDHIDDDISLLLLGHVTVPAVGVARVRRAQRRRNAHLRDDDGRIGKICLCMRGPTITHT
jgi:hypothetical protein